MLAVSLRRCANLLQQAFDCSRLLVAQLVQLPLDLHVLLVLLLLQQLLLLLLLINRTTIIIAAILRILR